jgi:hypothetical protein
MSSMTVTRDNDGFPDTVSERSDTSGAPLDGVHSDRLSFIQREANSILERLTYEYHSLQERINMKADEETQNATDVIERNRQLAQESLEKDFNQKRDAIDAVARQQIQHTYRMANNDRNRKSTDNLLSSPSRIFRPPLPFSGVSRNTARDMLDPPQIYLPVINAVVDFPRIYIKPYDTPALSPVHVSPFPELFNIHNSNVPSI